MLIRTVTGIKTRFIRNRFRRRSSRLAIYRTFANFNLVRPEKNWKRRKRRYRWL